MFVKVCGIRTKESIDQAVALGYRAAGFVAHPKSPRFCDAETIAILAAHAAGRIATVAVGISYDEVRQVHELVDYVQLYEFHATDRLIFASPEEPRGRPCDIFMYDASRGRGEQGPYPEWLARLGGRFMISGGLLPSNVAAVINKYRPCGVDVSSGVESSPGIKCYDLMKEFIREVRHAGG
jgi:phosphoribosylanthranilate isomerase